MKTCGKKNTVLEPISYTVQYSIFWEVKVSKGQGAREGEGEDLQEKYRDRQTEREN